MSIQEYRTKIDELITPNGEREITAEKVRDTLNTGADAMEEIQGSIQSSYKGIASTSTTPPATGSWWYTATEAGTYTNFLSGGSPIVVTAADLDVVSGVANNRVILEVQNGVATKRIERVKGDKGDAADPAKITTWTATTFASGVQVVYEGIVYESNAATVAGDIPGVSTKWVEKIGVADKSITPAKTDFVDRTRVNLFDKSVAVNGFFISSNNGVPTANASYIHSDYMPVVPGATYKASTDKDGAFYTAAKVFISGTTVPQSTYVAPANAAFYRASVLLTNKDTYMFSKDALPTTYTPYTTLKFSITDEGFKTAIKEAVAPTTVDPAVRFLGDTLLVTGDSITEVNARATKNWHSYLKDYLGFGTIKNDGKSGTGLVRDYAGQAGIYTRIDTWDATYGAFDAILLMGNMNDGALGAAFPLGTFADTTTATQYGALHATIQKLLTQYPNKPIGWIISTPRALGYDGGAGYGKNGWFEPYCKAILEVCAHYSIPCLDLYHNSGLRPWLVSNNAMYFSIPSLPAGDGIHPNELGQELMALKINEFTKQFL